MDISFVALIPIIYAVVEIAERFGLKKMYAHLSAIPLGILLSFFVLHNTSVWWCVLSGILMGLGAIGSCDAIGQGVEVFQCKCDLPPKEEDKDK